MLNLTIFIMTSSFFDGVSTAQQAIIMILLLSTAKPIKNSLGYMAGITISYFMCGIVGVLMVKEMNAFLKRFFPNIDSLPDVSYYNIEMIAGIVFFIAGPIYLLIKLKSKKPSIENKLISRLKNINPVISFILGVFISTTSFPYALPYIASIEKIAGAGINGITQIGFLALYNVIYALPLLIPFVFYLILRSSIEGIEKKLHLHVERINMIITVILFSGMGILFIIDSYFYIKTGHALFSSKIF